MRIRFVTMAHLQVLQASRMERHTMQDGTIPLSGLSPSAVSRQWGRVSGTPNDYFIWDGTKGYEVQVNTNLPIQFKNSALFAVANILTDAENVVDEKAECCNLGQGTLTLKIASSHQSQSLTACYFIIGY